MPHYLKKLTINYLLNNASKIDIVLQLINNIENKDEKSKILSQSDFISVINFLKKHKRENLLISFLQNNFYTISSNDIDLSKEFNTKDIAEELQFIIDLNKIFILLNLKLEKKDLKEENIKEILTFTNIKESIFSKIINLNAKELKKFFFNKDLFLLNFVLDNIDKEYWKDEKIKIITFIKTNIEDNYFNILPPEKYFPNLNKIIENIKRVEEDKESFYQIENELYQICIFYWDRFNIVKNNITGKLEDNQLTNIFKNKRLVNAIVKRLSIEISLEAINSEYNTSEYNIKDFYNNKNMEN